MAGTPSYRPTGPKTVAPGVNKSGTFAGGVGGSGPGRALSDAEKAAKSVGYNSRGAQAGRTAVGPAQTGPMGSGAPKAEWVGKGASKMYVDVPAANKDRNRVSTPSSYSDRQRSAAAAGVNAGTSRNAPTRSATAPATAQDAGTSHNAPSRVKSDVTTTQKKPVTQTRESVSAKSDKAAKDKASKMPAAPGTLNYFMRMTMKDSKGNDRARAYQMFKNYKKTGKLPGDMGSATQ